MNACFGEMNEIEWNAFVFYLEGGRRNQAEPGIPKEGLGWREEEGGGETGRGGPWDYRKKRV
jgi:hypothetical protein